MIISQSMLETNVIKVITFKLLYNDLVLPFSGILCIVVLGIVQLRENILIFVVSYTYNLKHKFQYRFMIAIYE